MFLGKCKYDITSYGDDNTPCTYDANLHIIIRELEDCTIKLFKYFKENYLIANNKKYHLLVTTDKPMSIIIEDNIIIRQKEIC